MLDCVVVVVHWPFSLAGLARWKLADNLMRNGGLETAAPCAA